MAYDIWDCPYHMVTLQMRFFVKLLSPVHSGKCSSADLIYATVKIGMPLMLDEGKIRTPGSRLQEKTDTKH